MSRTSAIFLALIAVVAGVAGALVGTPWNDQAPPSALAQRRNATPSPTLPADPTLSIVATAVGSSVPVYDASHTTVTSTLPNPIESGAPLTFLVRERRDSWIKVLLPLRPNGR